MNRRDFITATLVAPLVASVGAVTFQSGEMTELRPGDPGYIKVLPASFPDEGWRPSKGDIIMVVGRGSYRFDGKIWVSLDGMPNMRFID